jgi:hypothetical protein
MPTTTIIDILRDYYNGNVAIVANQSLKVIVEDDGAGTTYIGKAPAGSATDNFVWQIGRLTEFGPTTAIEWADGSPNFIFAWDDRAGLIYF